MLFFRRPSVLAINEMQLHQLLNDDKFIHSVYLPSSETDIAQRTIGSVLGMKVQTSTLVPNGTAYAIDTRVSSVMLLRRDVTVEDWENVRTVTVTAYLVTAGVSGQVWHGQLYFTGARYSNIQTDAASIATYGERQYVDIVEDLYSDNECTLRAKSILNYKKQAKNSLVLKSSVLDYGTSPILPGDMIEVTLPNESIVSVSFLVKSIDYHFLSETNILDVSLNLGYQKQLMADWIYALRARTDALNNYKARR